MAIASPLLRKLLASPLHPEDRPYVHRIIRRDTQASLRMHASRGRLHPSDLEHGKRPNVRPGTLGHTPHTPLREKRTPWQNYQVKYARSVTL